MDPHSSEAVEIKNVIAQAHDRPQPYNYELIYVKDTWKGQGSGEMSSIKEK